MTHYNPNKQIYVASDVSNFGLGAVILHKEDGKLKPIQHVSRTLLPVEMNYSQIEKRGLAIIFAIKTFHKYVHGREFILQTDHRPLLAVFVVKSGRKRQQETDSCINSREDTVVSFTLSPSL